MLLKKLKIWICSYRWFEITNARQIEDISDDVMERAVKKILNEKCSHKIVSDDFNIPVKTLSRYSLKNILITLRFLIILSDTQNQDKFFQLSKKKNYQIILKKLQIFILAYPQKN